MSMTKKIVVSAYWMCILPNVQNSQAGMNILRRKWSNNQAYKFYFDLEKLKMGCVMNESVSCLHIKLIRMVSSMPCIYFRLLT